jgi:D-aspartate ligase
MTATATIPATIEQAPLATKFDNATAGALVMGADYRGLGVVRSLGRHGIPVWLINQGGHSVAATSRYVERKVTWPAADDRTNVDYLLALGAKHNLPGWLLIPTDDYAVALTAHHHEALSNTYRLTTPSWEKLQWACDKRLLHRLAEELSIDQPWTACPSSREAISRLDCPFPVILKPALRLQPTSLATPKAWPAEDRQSLLARYDEASAMMPPEHLIIQEIVPGGGETQFSYAVLCRDGDVLASLVARRTRQYPADFGQLSTYVETVEEPRIIEPASRLLAAIRFTGLAEVEFKKDPRDGKFKLLDVNPRVWGWHSLSKRAGVDFPYLLWRLVLGKSVPELQGRAGEAWVHTSADLRVALGEILKGKLSVREYMRSLRRPLESAIFAWDDPMPGFLDLPLFAWTLGKRMLFRNGNEV